ncbi:putative DNA ligase OS=Streptomyces microflavus OX=1919 GN=lig PE=3 SV=1 [Streptomyces microflavus]
MLLAELAQVSLEVAATSARSKKVALLAALFRDAGPDDVPVVIPYLAGRLPQGRIGVGWRSLGDPVEPASEPTLTVTGVDAELTALAAVSGSGSQALRRERLRALFAAATADEQHFLRALLTGEVRQGALDAVAADALARAAEAPPADVRRAVMLAGSLQEVARTLLARTRRARRLPPHRRTAGPADAGPHRRLGHRGRRQAGPLRRRGEARRHPGPGAPARSGTGPRSSPGPSTTSPTGCPNWSPPWPHWTGRFILDGEVIALGDDEAAPVPGDRRPGGLAA